MDIRLLSRLRAQSREEYYLEMVTKRGGVRYYAVKDSRGAEVVCAYGIEKAKVLLEQLRREEMERLRTDLVDRRGRRKRMRY